VVFDEQQPTIFGRMTNPIDIIYVFPRSSIRPSALVNFKVAIALLRGSSRRLRRTWTRSRIERNIIDGDITQMISASRCFENNLLQG
jgi:hypothetical protein